MKKWLGKNIAKLAAGVVVTGAAAGSLLNAAELGDVFQPQNFKRFENEKQSSQYDYVAGDGEDVDLANEDQNGEDQPSGDDQQVLQVETEAETQLPGNNENTLGIAENKPDTKESENKNAVELTDQKKDLQQETNQNPSANSGTSGQNNDSDTNAGNGSGNGTDTDNRKETNSSEAPGDNGSHSGDQTEPNSKPGQPETEPPSQPDTEKPSGPDDTKDTEKPGNSDQTDKPSEDTGDNLDEEDNKQLTPATPDKTEKGVLVALEATITREYYAIGESFQDSDAEVYAVYQKDDGSLEREKLSYGGSNGYKIVFSTTEPGNNIAVFYYGNMSVSTKAAYEVLSSYVNIKYAALYDGQYYTSDFPGVPVKEKDQNAYEKLYKQALSDNRPVSGNIIDLARFHRRMIAFLGDSELEEAFGKQITGNYNSVVFLEEENGYLTTMLQGFRDVTGRVLQDTRSWLYYPASTERNDMKAVADIVVPVPDGYKVRRVVEHEGDLENYCGDQVLAGCPDQEELDVPMGITAVKLEQKSEKAKTLVLPESVQNIDIGSLAENLPNLENYEYASGDEKGLNRSGYKIQDGILYSADGKTLLSVPAGKKQVTVPETVTTLAENCFAGMAEDAVITFEGATVPVRKGATGFKGKIQIADSEYDLVRKAFEFAFEEESNRITFLTESQQEDPYQYIATGKILCDKEDTSRLLAVPQNTSGEYQVPESVKEIGEAAFIGCKRLTDIQIGASVVSLQNGSLILPSKVQTVTLGSGTTEIGTYLFGNPEEGAEVPAIHVYVEQDYAACLEKWREILDPVYGDGTADTLLSDTKPEYVYENGAKYQKLETEEGTQYRLVRIYKTNTVSIRLKDGTVQIASGALEDCAGLEILGLPDSLKSIENVDFSQNSALEGIYAEAGDVTEWKNDTLPEGVKICQTGKEYTGFTYEEGTVYGEKEDHTWSLLNVPTNWSGELSLSENTSVIADEALKDCTSLTAIQITDPDAVKKIGDSAFAGCTGMQSLDLGACQNLAETGSYAFSGCSALTEAVLPESVQILQEGTFENASALTAFTGKGVTEIGDRAFYRCESLAEIKNADATTALGEKAFFGCRSLKKIVLPASLRTLGESCFENCISIKEVNLDGCMTNIGRYCFANCQELQTITFGETIQKTLRVIGVQAFAGCSILETLDLTGMSELSQMGVQTFYGDVNLTTVKLPVSLKKLPDQCFQNCRNLSIVQLESEQITGLGTNVFGGELPSFLHIWVKESALEDYRKAYEGILDPAYGEGTTDNLLGIVDNTAMVIKGVLFEVTEDGMILKKASEELTGSYTVPEGTTAIAADAFAGCNQVTELIIPAGMSVSLGDRCMKGCQGLVSVIIRGDVPDWGEETFMDCTSVSQVSIGNASGPVIERIGTRAFKGCTGLSRTAALVFAGPVRIWGEECFAGCSNLPSYGMYTNIQTLVQSSLEIVEDRAFQGCTKLSASLTSKYTGLKSIGAYAFADCDSLKGPTIPAGVTYIGEGCFRHCDSLTTVSFYAALEEYPKDCFRDCPNLDRTGGTAAAFNALKRIGENAYSGCTSLTSQAGWNLGRYANLESIGDGAFEGCTNLASSELSATVKRIGTGAFDGCTNMDTLTLKSATPPEIGKMALSTMKDSFGIRVPDSKEDADSIYLAYLEYLTKLFDEKTALEILDSVSDGARERYLENKEKESESESESESERESESQKETDETGSTADSQKAENESEPIAPGEPETDTELTETEGQTEEIQTEPETESTEAAETEKETQADTAAESTEILAGEEESEL